MALPGGRIYFAIWAYLGRLPKAATRRDFKSLHNRAADISCLDGSEPGTWGPVDVYEDPYVAQHTGTT